MNHSENTVNLEAVLVVSDSAIKQGIEQAASLLFFVPFMHPDKFAESIGVTKGVVGGWIDNGYIPTAKVGKYRMVNMVVLVANLKKGVAV